jgi:hypothetical protein
MAAMRGDADDDERGQRRQRRVRPLPGVPSVGCGLGDGSGGATYDMRKECSVRSIVRGKMCVGLSDGRTLHPSPSNYVAIWSVRLGKTY